VCRALSHGRGDASPEEVDLVVRKALSGVARVHGRFGVGAAIALLAGVSDPRLERAGLEHVKTFGVLSDRSLAWLTRLLRRCTTAGWVDFQGDRARVVVLTAEGRAVMKGERPARIVLPDDAEPTSVSRRESKAAPQAEAMAHDEEALAVFEALRRHRMERAKAEGVPPYVVASDRTLRDIAMLRPRSLDELAVAHGIGPTKLERYGEGLLDTVRRARA
jgi:ATP-dependent DNA helicase RecQ